MEMDNKTWLINEIVTSDMDAKAKAKLVLMVRPLSDTQAINKGDIVQPVNGDEKVTFTVVNIKTFYLGEYEHYRFLLAVCYNHLTRDFCVIDYGKLSDKTIYKIVGHHEGGRMTWADG